MNHSVRTTAWWSLPVYALRSLFASRRGADEAGARRIERTDAAQQRLEADAW